MKINDLSFPYPVLGIGDDILPKPTFKGEPQVESDTTNYTFTVDFAMVNPTIKQVADSGSATYLCEVTCSSTLYRKSFRSQTTHFAIVIPKTHLGGRVDFQFTITVTKSIKAYTNPQFHEDYKGFSFDLEPGDLLGFLGEFSYDVDIKYDKLKSVGTFMQITEGPTLKLARFNLGGDKIDIQLPSTLYQQYRHSIMGNMRLANIIHSSIVFNALVTAPLDIQNFGNTLWARTIKYRFDTEATFEDIREQNALEELETDDIIELAQRLLSDPYGRLFNTISTLLDDED